MVHSYVILQDNLTALSSDATGTLDGEVTKRNVAFHARIAATHRRMKTSPERAVRHPMAPALSRRGRRSLAVEQLCGDEWMESLQGPT